MTSNSDDLTVPKFIDAINRKDIDGISDAITDDHVFIDAHGAKITGKSTILEGWRHYFVWFPDYKIEISEVVVTETFVVIFGFASGTYKGKTDHKKYHWRLPAAWRATVRDKKVETWQVFADTKIPFDSMESK